MPVCALTRLATPVALAAAVIVIVIVATLTAGAARAESPSLPAPTYDNTLYAFVYAPSIGDEAGFRSAADAILARVTPGPYAKVGLIDYFTVDLPWTAALISPVLSSPTRPSLAAILGRARARGLTLHISAMLGMSRAVWAYESAKREDRRIAQWYANGEIGLPGAAADLAVQSAYVTPSRYARKLRRHMEAKVRAFAQLFLDLRTEFPNTLISASGDAEAELNPEALNPALPYEEQLLADYSPFAILEFRDWLLHTGLYAPGGPYARKGYRRKRNETFAQGASALTPQNLARFNADFGIRPAFTSWSLRYFDWSLADPIDADPRAIRFKRYRRASWSPLPTSGPSYVAGGFDAPRAKDDPSRKLWTTWLRFRQKMLTNFVRDVATWVTTTPGPGGAVLPAKRWYSHQIPADYLNGTRPGSPYPNFRLILSASPLSTSLLPSNLGSPGVTVLDVLGRESENDPPGYFRTSEYSFDALDGLRLKNWGIPEYSPSWHIGVAPETSLERIKAQYRRAYAAGAHMFGFTPWPHFVDTANGQGLGAFLAEVRAQPRAAFHLPRDAFLRQLYRDLLGREATSTDLATWTPLLGSGQYSRARLAAGVADWPEARRGPAMIARYYLAILGRAPDTAGLQTWLAYLVAGGCSGSSCSPTRRQEIVNSFVSSAEFAARYGSGLSADAFVAAMFQAILGRSPSSSERTSYVSAINGGSLTRGAMARQLAESSAAVALWSRDVLVVLEYLALLGRTPSDADLAAWRTRLAAGFPQERMAQIFLASPEYAARLD